jgi:hypothetical protein
MQYMLSFYEQNSEIERRQDPEQAPIYWSAWNAYVKSIAESGIMVSGNGLEMPSNGTFVSIQNGKRVIQDGPYPDTKEHLGGYFIIEVKDLDEALEWASRSPNAQAGRTEIRPVLPKPE